ncbi:hypothetical protein POKO110462_10970 [Pontibacter korlensis]|uniref:STAS/SEC14 domain-containing protein n=1 Tax=Pontibacter korlensis TaxID=400092 RepID=A0A0E3ZG18_9BACT|nr:hypothetical protein [Pontibacter korlensis]AKD04629.1 hypothetical protein PKOR_17910 [Pontibacter korlensis]
MFVLKKDYATAEVDIKKSRLKLTWLRQPNEEEFKEAFSVSMETVRENELRFFLADNRVGINMDLALQRWAANFGTEISDKLKLERYARVIPPDAMQEVVSYKMFDYVTQHQASAELELKVFYRMDEAEKWLFENQKHANKPSRKYK